MVNRHKKCTGQTRDTPKCIQYPLACPNKQTPLIAKLPLASAPFMVERERESKKRSLLVRCFTFPAAPVLVERESKRRISTSHGHEHVHSCIG